MRAADEAQPARRSAQAKHATLDFSVRSIDIRLDFQRP